jgi:CRP/FNR family transcriptional regulator, cyclic AMP receptor protein
MEYQVREAARLVHLPQETLAQLVGVTRQRINQILKDWQREGLIDHQYWQTVAIAIR